MVLIRRLAPLLVVALAAASEAPVVSKNPTHSFSVESDGRRLVEVKLYVTADGAKTWTLAQDLQVSPDAKDAPRLSWTAPQDGEYGFIISSAYADRQVDPAPRAGEEPAVRLAIDRQPPRIVRFAATAAGANAVAVTWHVDEPHPGGVRVERSEDAKTWTTLAPLERASGETTLAIGGARAQSLRLVAVDAAGNEAAGEAVAVTLPDDAFASAVRDLPTIEPAPAANSAVPTSAPANPAAAPTPSGPAAPTAVAAPAAVDAPTVAASTPTTVRPPDPTDLPWQKGARVDARADDKPPQPPKKTRKPKPEVVTAKPERRPAYQMPAKRVFIKGDEAAAALARAREAAADEQRSVEALDLYRQLRDSDRAREAAPEELRLLAAEGDADEAIAYARSLPPELNSDAARLELARLLRASGRRDEAIAVAGSVARASAEADPAALLVAACLRDADRIADARKLYQHVANGGGPHAAEAAAELAALPPR